MRGTLLPRRGCSLDEIQRCSICGLNLDSLSRAGSSSVSSLYGAISEVRYPVHVISSRGRRKRELRTIRKREEEIRKSHGFVSCSASGRAYEESAESGYESQSLGQGPCDDVITFFQDGSSSRDRAARSGVRSKMATNRSTPPLASVTESFTTNVSSPFMDCVENFDQLNWKGKVTVSAVVVAGLAAATFAGVKVARGLHGGVRNLMSKNGGGNSGGKEDGGGSLPYDVVAKGFSTVQSNLGPWSFPDLTLGLSAISKVTEKGPPEPPGKPSEEFAKNASFLARAQHWRSLAEAVYSCEPGSFSLQSMLPESAIVAAEWNPCHETLRPAYAVSIDAPHGAVVLSVRGTSQIVDMLVNSGASAEPFLVGQAHGGFVKATDQLVEQVVPHIKKAFEEQSKNQKGLKLVITGHSMGAAVGIMAGMKLKQSSEFPNIECWGYCTPACVTLDVARECKDFATSFISHHDVVPRFSIAAVELLRKRISDFDWEKADKIVGEDDDWSNIRSASEGLKSAQGKQKEMSKSMDKAQEGLGEQMDNVNEKIGRPVSDDDSKDKDNEEDKEEKKKEHPPLYPAGRLFVLVSDPPGSGKLPENRDNVASGRSSGTYPTFDEVKKVKWELYEADPEDLKEIVVSPWCVSDHMIGYLGEGIGNLQRHCEPAFGGSPDE